MAEFGIRGQASVAVGGGEGLRDLVEVILAERPGIPVRYPVGLSVAEVMSFGSKFHSRED